MATIFNHPASLPPMPAVTRIPASFTPEKIGATIEILIALLDASDADADVEPASWPEDMRAADPCPASREDDEPTGDEDDAAYTEWNTRGRHKLERGEREPRPLDEDDEHDEAPEDDDPGGCEHDGREPENVL